MCLGLVFQSKGTSTTQPRWVFQSLREVTVLSVELDVFSVGWSYGLNVDVDGRNHWLESALRKKHRPSEYTFEQLISQKVAVDV